MAVEYPNIETVLTTDTFEVWRQKTNAITTFNSAVKDNIGDLSLLSTEDKFSIVNAINEVHNDVSVVDVLIGDLTLLNSDISAVDLVSAINKNYEYQKNNTDTQISTEKTNRENADTAIQSELDRTQLSMGINADGTFTTFSDATYVNTSTNIRSAVGTLDTSLKSNSDLLDALVSSVGAGSNGSLNIPTSVNYIDPTEDIKDNIVILDSELKSVANSVSNFPSLAAANETKINNIITSIGSDATGTISAYDPALLTATASDLSTNIKLLDNKIELLDAKDTSIDAEIANLTSIVGSIQNSQSVIGDIADLSDGFPRKNTIVTIVDALNALNDSVSAIVAEYEGGDGGWVLKKGDTMTGGLKIVDANLMVGEVSQYDIEDGDTGKIVATGDIEAFFGQPTTY